MRFATGLLIYFFQFSVSITVGEKSFAASSIATNKKSAQKKCALDLVIQLYKAKMIEGNTGKRIKPRHGPSSQRGKVTILSQEYRRVLVGFCFRVLSRSQFLENDTSVTSSFRKIEEKKLKRGKFTPPQSTL